MFYVNSSSDLAAHLRNDSALTRIWAVHPPGRTPWALRPGSTRLSIRLPGSGTSSMPGCPLHRV